MDWESRYLGKIEQELNMIQRQLEAMEQKITDNLDRSMTRLVLVNKERVQEYMSLNQRIDGLSGKVDRAVQWTVKMTAGIFVAVCGLVVTVLTRLL